LLNLKTHWNKALMHAFIHSLHLSKVLFTVLLVTLFTFETPRIANMREGLDRTLSGWQFDLAGWIMSSALAKSGYELAAPQHRLDDAAQGAFVRDYLRDLNDVRDLEARINAVFADPNVKDAQTESRVLRETRDAQRAALAIRQRIAEAILQEQVETVLREEGFAIGGQTLPPVRFQLTQLPHLLVVSRRDRIEKIDQRELATGLKADDFDNIERQTETRFDVSALVTPIGGYGTYPAMLPETPSLNFIVNTAAHEWTHIYLLASPVGVNYGSDGVARTINETSAQIVEREIGQRVLERFYPREAAGNALIAALATDVVPASDTARYSHTEAKAHRVVAQQAFDFNAEMRETRLQTDALLEAGRIDDAERYMEERRQRFVANGYLIRRLNQAYFAFYGAYNARPGGAPEAGRDPVGPAVQDLRTRAPSLGAFVRAIATVRTLADVEAALR
jgi:hypothetical protein